jgi:hypothetical protein
VQIFIHDIVVAGPLRDTDAVMQQGASEAAQQFASIPGFTFTGVRLFIERAGGQDKCLIVIEGAKQGGQEFPTGAELDQLETNVRNGLLSGPGMVSVGQIRFHSLTAPAA